MKSAAISKAVDALKAKALRNQKARGKTVREAVQKAERHDGEGRAIGGTGETILKLQKSPITRIADNGIIRQWELVAAEEIITVWKALSGGLMFKAPSMERRDPSHDVYEPTKLVDAMRRYKAWAKFWSERALRKDPTLQIVYDVVVDERPLRIVEQDHGIRNGKAARVVADALRDYVARAEWCEPRTAREWKAEAVKNFPLKRFA